MAAVADFLSTSPVFRSIRSMVQYETFDPKYITFSLLPLLILFSISLAGSVVVNVAQAGECSTALKTFVVSSITIGSALAHTAARAQKPLC